MRSTDPVNGVRNLLENCVQAKAGESLLLVTEDPAHNYSCAEAPGLIAGHAAAMGLDVRIIEAPVLEDPVDFPDDILTAIRQADHTVFLARLGDQVRFQAIVGGGSKTMCYALDADYLRAPFAELDQVGMVRLKGLLEAAFDAAQNWQVTCPAGTDITGTFLPPPDEGGDVTIHRFPMLTYRPILAGTMRGRVALSRWLIGTGSRLYEPFELLFDDVVFAHVEDGRITGFEGAAGTVERINAHYDFVSQRFGIDRNVVHSFHTGLNPQTFYPGRATDNLQRWGGVAFGALHYLHFHTCGDYAPGEICWSVFDPTIRVDGEAFWQDGAFPFAGRPQVQRLFNDYPGLAKAFASPRRDIGL